MNAKEIVEKINLLLSYSEIIENGWLDRGKGTLNYSKYFEDLEKSYNIYIGIEHIELYRELLFEIFKKGDIKDNYTIKTVAERFNAFLIETKVRSGALTEPKFQKYLQNLINAEKKKILVFHKIYGIDIQGNQPVDVGCFTFYKYSKHKKAIVKKTETTSLKVLLNHFAEFSKHDFWVSTEIEVVDKDKAQELAYRKFEALQGIFQLLIDIKRLSTGHAICILNDINMHFDMCYKFSDSEKYSSFNNDLFRCENIEIEYFVNDKDGLLNSIISKIFTSEKNEIHEKLINAFIAYSRTIYEYSNAQKFVLFTTAIEALIGRDVTSLSKNISKWFSAMICRTQDVYESMKKDFYAHYNIRCEISHGSRVTVLEDDTKFARSYAAELIMSFLSDENILNLKKTKELECYLDKKVKDFEESNT